MANYPPLLNAEEKELLLAKYSDLEFVDVDEECKCGRCERVMIHHYFSQCGHAYCKNCKNLMDDGSQKWKCSQCGDYITQIALGTCLICHDPDPADEQRLEMEIKVNALPTHCPNKKYGCDFKNILSNIPKHLETCESTRESALPVEIYHESNIKAVLRKLFELTVKFDSISSKMNSMEEKVKIVESKNRSLECQIKSIHEVQKTSENKMKENEIELQNVIKKINVPPKKSVSKDDLRKRLKTFKDELDVSQLATAISEKNDAEAKLKLVEEQMQSNYHLLLEQSKKINEGVQELFGNKLNKEDIIKEASAALVNRENQNNISFQKQMKRIEYKMEARATSIEEALLFKGIQLNICSLTELNWDNWQVHKWEIPDINKIVAQETCLFQNLNIAGLDMVLLFNPKQGSIKLNSVAEDKVKKMRLFPRVNFVIKETKSKNKKNESKNKRNKDENLDMVKYDSQALYSPSYQTNLRYEVFTEEFSKLNSRYKTGNKMEIEVCAEPIKIYKQFYSNNGILISKIANFKTSKKLEANGCVEGHLSPYFYTSDLGHRVQAEVKLHGNCVQNNQDVVTVSIMFLPGLHKSPVKWRKDDPFHHKTTVTIYNHKNASKHLVQSVKKICKTENDWESKYSLQLTFPSKDIQSSGFIKNGTLYYKIEIVHLEI